jgi:hypothetical protein
MTKLVDCRFGEPDELMEGDRSFVKAISTPESTAISRAELGK